MDFNKQQNQCHESHELERAGQVVVIMVPFPAQSHLNQLLELSCTISSSYNVRVHYACSTTQLKQAKLRFNNKDHPSMAKINFHELPIPPFQSPPPVPTTKFPTQLQPSWEASLHLRKPISQLLQEISPTAGRIIVIHDVLMSYVVQDIVTIPNGISYSFNPISAFASFFSGRKVREEAPQGLPSNEGCTSPEFLEFVVHQVDYFRQRSGMILNSTRLIEGNYIDLLASENSDIRDKIWAIGPLNQGRGSSNFQHPCLEWLNKQAPKSVIYVSFGTTTSQTDGQIKEIAEGLELSKQNFIWVLRDADKGDIFLHDYRRADGMELLGVFEERVKERGLVIRDWAPQLEILGHPSTGGFMSHCGWNSCLEAITLGVPIAAWPMHSDQPKNAFLVAEILKAGLVVNEWSRREETVTSSTISEAVRRLMATKEGKEMKKRAEELGSAVRQGVEEGGVSSIELNSFMAHVTS